MLFLLLAGLGAAGAAAMKEERRYGPWLTEHFRLGRSDYGYWAGCAALWLMDRAKLADRLTEPLSKVHQIMVSLHGAKAAAVRTRWFAAQSLMYAYSLLMLTIAAGWAAGGSAEMIAYGLLLALFVPFLLYKQAAGEWKRRRELMLIELPELLNRLMLLVGAGETVQQALVRSVEAAGSASGSPLYNELTLTVHALKLNVSFAKALEDFSKRCRMQEVSLFTTTLLLNYRRGGDELVMSLKELSVILWDKRKAQARILGEEASSKMVFPMVLIFFVVMILVAAPALFLMKG